MIVLLLRTEISGNLKTLIALGVSSLFGLFMFVFATGMRDLEPIIALTLIPLAIALLFIYVRAKRERRTRLLAQLPVTQLQIVLAEWCFVLMLLLIPGTTLTIAGLLHADYNSFEVLQVVLAYFSLAVTALAVLAIAMNIGKLTLPYSSVLQWLWIVLVLFFTAFAPIFSETGNFFWAKGDLDWARVAVFYFIFGLILIGTNIWLHQRAADYLGNE